MWSLIGVTHETQWPWRLPQHTHSLTVHWFTRVCIMQLSCTNVKWLLSLVHLHSGVLGVFPKVHTTTQTNPNHRQSKTCREPQGLKIFIKSSEETCVVKYIHYQCVCVCLRPRLPFADFLDVMETKTQQDNREEQTKAAFKFPIIKKQTIQTFVYVMFLLLLEYRHNDSGWTFIDIRPREVSVEYVTVTHDKQLAHGLLNLSSSTFLNSNFPSNVMQMLPYNLWDQHVLVWRDENVIPVVSCNVVFMEWE